METHSSVLAWRIPGMGEPGGLPSLGSHRVGHDWSDLAAAAAARTPPPAFPIDILFCVFCWLFLTFYFVLGCSQLTNKIVIVSGKQRRDSATHTHVPILPQTPLPWTVMLTLSSLPSAAQFSRSLLVIHLNYARVYMSISNFLNTDSSDPVPSASLLS